MECIVTHARADFDAFASMLCASKIFPEALPVLPSTTVYKLRELQSLYRDVADFRNVRYLRKLKSPTLQRMIVVDTKKRGQLIEFEPYLERVEARLLIFDHHPPTSDDLTRGVVEQFPYGANVTGLFRKLLDQGIHLAPQEATLVLLGIYADTGSLTYPATTSEDAMAVGELLRLRADLQTVNHYLRPFFDPAQLYLFQEMLSTFQEMDMEGYKVVLVKQRLDHPIQGISILLSNASDMVGADAILGVFQSNKKKEVQILIQSLVPEIQAAEIAAHFGGGGHPGAASALLPKGDLDAVAETLIMLMTEVPLPCTKVRDVMTRNVVSVTADLPLHVVEERLLRKGIHGAPVLDRGGGLVGVISLRDVEKARIQGLLHAPTSGFMSKRVITVSPEAPLITARKLITSHDIGRLPVVVDSSIVGIVSRADILRSSNRGALPAQSGGHPSP